jgi:hypothetical protein
VARSFVALSPVFASFENYGFYPIAAVSAPTHLTYGEFPELLGVIGEYLPNVSSSSGAENTAAPTLTLYRDLFNGHAEAKALSSATCSVTEPGATKFEALQIRLTVKCSHSTRLAVPISYNGYTSIEVRSSGGRLNPLPYHHVPSDPRIVVFIRSRRSMDLVVRLPTLWSLR